MAALEMTTDESSVHLTVRGPVDRPDVDRLRAALGATDPARVVEVDLREVTGFPQLGIAVLVSARRWFGDRLRIRGSAEVVAMVEDAGLARTLHLVG